MVGIGNMMGPLGSNQMLSRLGIEVGRMGSELAGMQTPLSGLMKSMQDAFQATMMPAPGPLGPVGSRLAPLILQLAFVAILKNAMEKAAAARLFNIETAKNDLWVHLDAISKSGTQPIASATPDAVRILELSKLRDVMEKQQQLFQMLSDILRNIKPGAALASLRG